MPRVSIIVPVYKVERYLSRCIDSILAQTFTDFELLLIDDGSPDNCGEICDEYAKKDNRIRVFHKENGGVSSARNLGLLYSQGEILMFADGDDTVEPGWCKGLATPLLQINGIDLALSSYNRISIDGISKKKLIDNSFLGIQPRDTFWDLHKTYMTASLWNKAFWSSIVRKNNLKFDITLCHGEDLIFIMQYIRSSNGSFYVADNADYNYFMREGSLVHTYWRGMWECQKKCMKEVDDVLTSCGCQSAKESEAYYSNLIDSFSESINCIVSEKGNRSIAEQLGLLREITSCEKYQSAIKKGMFRGYNKVYCSILRSCSPSLIYLFNACVKLKHKLIKEQNE